MGFGEAARPTQYELDAAELSSEGEEPCRSRLRIVRGLCRCRHPVTPRGPMMACPVIGFPEPGSVDAMRQRHAPHPWRLTRLRCHP
jgi:hypothetical protein